MKYEKINTVFKRDTKENGHVIMPGNYSMEEFLNTRYWSVSEKTDGQCITITLTKDEIKITGKSEKTVFNEAHKELLAYINEKIIPEVVNDVFDFTKADTVTLYGEGYGPKIQSGGKYREDQSFILFDVNIDGIWMMEEDVTRFADEFGIDRVPLLGIMTIDNVLDFIQKRPLSQMAAYTDTPMEGVVCRSDPLVLDRMGRRVIFKLKLSDYNKLEARNKNVE